MTRRGMENEIQRHGMENLVYIGVEIRFRLGENEKSFEATQRYLSIEVECV